MNRFYYAGSPGAGSADVKARSGPISPLSRGKGRIVMKTSCVSCARRAIGGRGMTTTPRQHPSWLLKIIEAKRRPSTL